MVFANITREKKYSSISSVRCILLSLTEPGKKKPRTLASIHTLYFYSWSNNVIPTHLHSLSLLDTNIFIFEECQAKKRWEYSCQGQEMMIIVADQWSMENSCVYLYLSSFILKKMRFCAKQKKRENIAWVCLSESSSPEVKESERKKKI